MLVVQLLGQEVANHLHDKDHDDDQDSGQEGHVVSEVAVAVLDGGRTQTTGPNGPGHGSQADQTDDGDS